MKNKMMKQWVMGVGVCLMAMASAVHGVESKGDTQNAKPSFDLSAKARAEREQIYSVPGRANLTGKNTPLKDGMKIAFYGDSITMQGRYIREIKSALKEGEGTRSMSIQVFQHGLNGGRVPTVLEGKCPWGDFKATMQELLDREKADVVSIWLGVNDVWHGKNGTSPEDFEAGLKKMVAMARAAGARVVVLAPLAVLKEDAGKWNPKADEYVEITRKVAADTGAGLADLRKAFKAYLQNNGTETLPDGTITFKGRLLTYDGVHANEEGGKVVADIIAQAVCDALKKTDSGEASVKQPPPGGKKTDKRFTNRVARYAKENPDIKPGGIVLLGDSITEGFMKNKQSLPADWNVINRGIWGDVIGSPARAGVLDRLAASAYDVKPAEVYLMIGINDILFLRTPQAIMEQGYEEILKGLRANCPEARIVVQSVLPVAGRHKKQNSQVQLFNESIRKLAVKHGCAYLDLYSLFCDADGNLKEEYHDGHGLHLSPKGYARWAEELSTEKSIRPTKKES